MDVQTLTAQELKRRADNGEVLHIVDVRTPAEFAQVHAQGARSVPLDRLDPDAVKNAHPPDEPIYLICKSGGRSTKACQRLAAAGIANVFSIEGGISAWEQTGLPVVRGTSRIISLERQVRIAAGSLVLIGLLLAWLVHPALAGLSAFVGAGLVFAGITDFCGMAMLLAKMPWNRRG
jgi:rhodanese-related sulfurtransferase